MPSNPRNLSEETLEPSLGSLRACLVEGDATQRARERRVRRRALIISVSAQTVILAALVLFPLFGKTERLVARDFVPIPPYGHPRQVVHGDRSQTSTTRHHFIDTFSYHPNIGRSHPDTQADSPVGDTNDLDSLPSSPTGGQSCSWCVPVGRDSGPTPPQTETHSSDQPQIVHFRSIDPAKLAYRVEPVYPTLPKQIHKEGRVELRAIIATDGSIQSLEIVGGDPMFYLSAKEAVSQWRYKPTYLNGQPVQVDTYITVIYTLQH